MYQCITRRSFIKSCYNHHNYYYHYHYPQQISIINNSINTFSSVTTRNDRTFITKASRTSPTTINNKIFQYQRNNNYVSISSLNKKDDDTKEEYEEEYENEYDEEEDEIIEKVRFQPLRPWQQILKYPSRASWRTSQPKSFPKIIKQKQDTIIQNSNRTTKQLHRTYIKLIERYNKLSLGRERERRVLVNGTLSGNDSMVYKDKGGRDANPIYHNVEQTIIQLNYRLYKNYCVVQRVCHELSMLLPNFKPRNVIDVGCGVGSASLASLSVFNDNNDGSDDDANDDSNNSIQWIHGIDPSRSMRDVSKELISSYNTNITHTQSERITTTEDSTASTQDSTQNFDLALVCYTNQEFTNKSNIITLQAILYEKLKPGGIIIIIEPGNPDGFNTIRDIREMFLSCNKENHDNKNNDIIKIIAPCTHMGTCPMIRHVENFETMKNLRKHENNNQSNETLNKNNLNKNNDSDFNDHDAFFDYMHFGKQPDSTQDDDNKNTTNGVTTSNNKNGMKEEKRVSVTNTKSATNAIPTKSGTTLYETKKLHTTFCSFVQNIPDLGITYKGQNKNEKFSYLVLQKVDNTTTNNEKELNNKQNDNVEDNTSVVDILKQSIRSPETAMTTPRPPSHDTLEDIPKQINQWSRIIRAPIKRKQHIILDVCHYDNDLKDGHIIRNIVSKEKMKYVNGLYASARKSRWGGLWPDLTD